MAMSNSYLQLTRQVQ